MNAIALIFAFVVFITIVARGADHPTRPSNTGWRARARLHAEKLALLLVGAASASVIIEVLAGMTPPPAVIALTIGSGLWMLSHPAGWFRYVVKGKQDQCQGVRADP